MVTKSKATGSKKKGKVKLLNLNKETVKELTKDERKRIKGGHSGAGSAKGYAGETNSCFFLRNAG
jgi:hypothetical protein